MKKFFVRLFLNRLQVASVCFCFFLSSFIRWFISTRRIALDSEVVRIKDITTKWQTRVLYIYIHVRCCIIPDKKERIRRTHTQKQHFQYMKSSTRSQWKKMETEVFFLPCFILFYDSFNCCFFISEWITQWYKFSATPKKFYFCFSRFHFGFSR